MNNNSDNDREMTRKCIFGLINLIASKDEQIKYQQDVPIANVPSELICMWFDDHFPIGKRWFKECFSKPEQEKIKEFSDFYESKRRLLPKTDYIEDWHKNKIWQQIVDKAIETAKELEIEDYPVFC